MQHIFVEQDSPPLLAFADNTKDKCIVVSDTFVTDQNYTISSLMDHVVNHVFVLSILYSHNLSKQISLQHLHENIRAWKTFELIIMVTYFAKMF